MFGQKQMLMLMLMLMQRGAIEVASFSMKCFMVSHPFKLVLNLKLFKAVFWIWEIAE